MTDITTAAPGDSAAVRIGRFREELRVIRLVARMSQGDLAGEVGKSQSWVSAIESGERIPRIDEALLLAEVLRARTGHNILEVLIK